MSREYISKTLKRLREQSGLTVYQVGELVGKSGKTVSAWENNHGQPDAEMLMKLCDIYNVKNILDEFRENRITELQDETREHIIIDKYRKLTPHGKEIVNCVIDKELELQSKHSFEEDMPQEQTDITLIKLPYYDFPASAGIGNFTDYEYATYVEVKNPPRKADYIVRVSGDSMEPTLYDGDKLYIQKTNVLDIGDIGLFAYRGSIYVKEYGRRGLVSRNKEYSLIEGSDDIRILGKVLGKVKN